MQNQAGRSAYGDGQGIGDRVIDRDELALELADGDLVTVGDDALWNVPQLVLAEFLCE
jgi:hypothetical protein